MILRELRDMKAQSMLIGGITGDLLFAIIEHLEVLKAESVTDESEKGV